MGESKISLHTNVDDINKTIDEYRSIVDSIIQKEKSKLRQLYDKEANVIINGAWKKAEEIIAASQKEAQATREKLVSQARKEAADTINTAKFEAQKIISEAETRDKKDAKIRIRSEMEKLMSEGKEEYNSIILKARTEYNTIILEARKVAEKEVSQMIAKSREEAERLIRNDVAKYKIAAQEQLEQEVAEAQKKAKGKVDEIIVDSVNVSQAILQVFQKGDSIMDNFKNEMQAELDELSKVIAAARKKTELVTFEAVAKTISPGTPLETSKNVVLSVHLKGEKPAINGDGHLFKGQMELRTDSAGDFTIINRLRDFLLQIPNIKFAGEASSEDEASISFEIKENLPMVDILSNMPLVEKLDIQPEGIKLVMKN